MILEILQGARRIDDAIGRKIGPAYQALFTVGLAVEIGRRVVDLRHLPPIGTLREILSTAFFAVLLLHQLAELAERLDRRRNRAAEETMRKQE